MEKYILIDPFLRIVKEVEIEESNRLSRFYKLMDCRFVESALYIENGDCIYVDDEGMFKQDLEFFYYEDTCDPEKPLSGVSIIVGTDEEGRTIPPKTTLEEAVKRVKWIDNIHEWLEQQ